MLGNGGDHALGCKLLDGCAGQATVDAHTVSKDGGSDHLVLWHLNEELVVGGLLKEHGVVNLGRERIEAVVMRGDSSEDRECS